MAPARSTARPAPNNTVTSVACARHELHRSNVFVRNVPNIFRQADAECFTQHRVSERMKEVEGQHDQH